MACIRAEKRYKRYLYEVPTTFIEKGVSFMRIAVSDYDGTIASRSGLIGDVVPAIEKWRGNGDIFGIATGRDLPMTLAETDKWGIPFDFLICVNGAAIYDHEKKLLKARLLTNSLVPRLLTHPAAMASMHYQLSGLGPLKLLLRENSWFPRIGVPYTEVTMDQALALTDLGQVSFAYDTAEECEKWTNRLAADLGSEIAIHPNKITIDINAPGVDKATGIEELLVLKDWGRAKVFVIGDGGNDVEMIERFSGFTVPNADPGAERLATRVFVDVPEMLASV
jgi:HAD-superfamily hydrolase, subfamily IIB